MAAISSGTVKTYESRELEEALIAAAQSIAQALAFRTVAVATTIERIAFVAALIATFEVAAQRSRAAHLDGAHDAPLYHRHRRAVLLTISFSVAAEDVRHFELGTVHAARRSEGLRRDGGGFYGYGHEGAGREGSRPSILCW
jgi:hypothetical protein